MPTSLSRTPAISNYFSKPLRVRDSGVLQYLLKITVGLGSMNNLFAYFQKLSYSISNRKCWSLDIFGAVWDP